MTKEKRFSICFGIVGLYDILLGGAFLLFFRNIYKALDITLPNHPGYIFVPALFLICGGLAEFMIAKNPLRNTDLAIVRLIMKLSFAGAIAYCALEYGVPIVFMIVAAISVLSVMKSFLFLGWAYAEKKRR